jgi:hypothetical protein
MDTHQRTLLGTVAGKDASEGSAYLDELARGVADGNISRGQTLKWLGTAGVALATGSLFPEQAEALTRRQRRMCRRRGGTPLERGECHCGFNCGGQATSCHGNTGCFCLKTTENRGFCGTAALGCGATTCTASGDCPTGYRCVVNTCCGEPVCAPPCPTEPLGVRGTRAASGAATCPYRTGILEKGPRLFFLSEV